MSEIRFKQFDQVRLRTVKNVTYLSHPPGIKPTTDGIWQVSAIVDNQLLLVKNNIVIKISPDDVLKVMDYDLSNLTSTFGKLRNG